MGFLEKLIHKREETNIAVTSANGGTPNAYTNKDQQLATGATLDAKAVFDKTFGKDLHVLADPKSTPLECAKAFSSLAGNVKSLVSVSGAIDKVGDFALKRLERDELPDIARAVNAGKFGKDAYEIKESLEKVHADVEALQKSPGIMAAYHLKHDLGKLDKQMTEAAEHLHGIHGEHAMAPGGAGAVALVASPLDALQIGQPASISHGHDGPSVQQTPAQQLAPEVGRA